MDTSAETGIQPTREAWRVWMESNASKFETPWERDFAKAVLVRVDGLNPDSVTCQHVISGLHGEQFQADFVITEPGVQIAMEVDGWDKTRSGAGATWAEHLKANRRDALLARCGWSVIRFAHSQLRREEDRQLCTLAVGALLRQLRQATPLPAATSVETNQATIGTPSQRWTITRRST